MEDMIQDKVAQKENELHATYDERLRNYEERYGACIERIFLQAHAIAGSRTSRSRCRWRRTSYET